MRVLDTCPGIISRYHIGKQKDSNATLGFRVERETWRLIIMFSPSTRSKRKSEHQIGKSFRICQCNEPASILLLCLREVLNSAKRATMKFWPFTPSLPFSFSPPFDSSRTHLQLFKSSFKSRQIKKRTHILPCKTSRHVGLWKWHYCNSNIFQNHFTLHKLQSSSYVQSASYESDEKKNQIMEIFQRLSCLEILHAAMHVTKCYLCPSISLQLQDILQRCLVSSFYQPIYLSYV